MFVRPVTRDGDTLTFYLDTGGGSDMLFASAAERLGLQTDSARVGGQDMVFSDWPQWRADASIPPASDSAGPSAGRLLVVPFGGQLAALMDSTDAGFLGGKWFAGRTWTLDYSAGELWLRAPGDLPPHQPEHEVTLGFQVDSAGRRTTHFARINAVIDGDSLDFLFDAGATTILTDSALQVLADGRPARRAASFLSAAVFDSLRARHPDWRTVKHGSSFGMDFLEVPAVEIAGWRVGPVWFERRPIGAFERYMSSMMDRPVVGALGGEAFRFFRITIDYPNAIAVFERP